MNTQVRIQMLLDRANHMRDTVTRVWLLLDVFERNAKAIAGASLATSEKVQMIEARRLEFLGGLQRELGEAAPCECHTSEVPAAPFSVAASIEGKQPSPGPWTVGEAVKEFGEDLALYTIDDRDRNPVLGVYVIAGIGCTDAELANVALVMSAPMILREAQLCMEALDPPRGIFSVSEATYYANQVEYVKARLQAMIAAATPIGRKPATPEGGAA